MMSKNSTSESLLDAILAVLELLGCRIGGFGRDLEGGWKGFGRVMDEVSGHKSGRE